MTSLLDLVLSLEAKLTDSKLESQKESMLELVEGIQSSSHLEINTNEVDCLIDFLSGRLAIADPSIVSAIMDGFLWLIVHKIGRRCLSLEPAQVERICMNGLFGHLSIQTLSKSIRLKVFQLLYHVLTGEYWIGIQKVSENFIINYLQAIDGEKDPQILLLIFEMNLIIVTKFHIDRFKDELFDAMSVYFPVDYTPPPNSAQGIGVSRQDLVNQLHCGLFAMRNYNGHNLIPLLCAKADSHLLSAQLDSLKLLNDCLFGRLNHAEDKFVISDEVPIELTHVSAYLVVILPILVNIAKQPRWSVEPTELDQLANQCLAGLLHTYTMQTNDCHELEDFLMTVMRSMGLSLSDLIGSRPPNQPNQAIISYLLTVTRSSAKHSICCTILFSDLFVPYLCAPFLNHSVTALMNETDVWEAKQTFDSLIGWHDSVKLFCQLADIVDINDFVRFIKTHSKITDNLGAIHSSLHTLMHNTQQILTHPDVQNSLSASSFHFFHFKLCHLMNWVNMVICYGQLQEHTTVSTTHCSDLVFRIVKHYINILNLESSEHVADNQSTVGNENNTSLRSELFEFVTTIYKYPTPLTSMLNEFLLDHISAQKCQLPNKFVIDLLKHCVRQDFDLFEQIVQYLFVNRMPKLLDTTATEDDDSPLLDDTGLLWNRLLNSVLSTKIAQLNTSMHCSNSVALGTTCTVGHTEYLYNLLLNNQAYFKWYYTQLVQLRDESTMMAELVTISQLFFLATHLLDSNRQKSLLDAYRASLCDNWILDNGSFLISCSILSGLQPELFNTSYVPVRLLDFILLNTEQILSPSHCLPSTSANEFLLKIAAATYTSILNKTLANGDHGILKQVDKIIDKMEFNVVTNIHIPYTFLLWCVKCLLLIMHDSGTIGIYSIDRYVKIMLFQSELMSPAVEATNLDRWIACLNLIPDVFSNKFDEYLHTPINTFDEVKECYYDNLFNYILKNVLAELQVISSKMKSFPHALTQLCRIRDIFLKISLTMLTHLPSDVVTGHFADIMPQAMLAIVSSTDVQTRLCGLQFMCRAIDIVHTTTEVSSLITSNQIDDLLVRLPRLIPDSTSAMNSNKSENHASGADAANALVRLLIARCLTILYKLSPNVANRYRDSEVLPLLDRLVDDPNKHVRREAVCARNAWLI